MSKAGMKAERLSLKTRANPLQPITQFELCLKRIKQNEKLTTKSDQLSTINDQRKTSND